MRVIGRRDKGDFVETKDVEFFFRAVYSFREICCNIINAFAVDC